MSDNSEFRRTAERVKLYSSVVIVCLSMLVMGALPKLLPGNSTGEVDMAAQWVELYKLPLWFMTVTGVLEVGAGLLVLFPLTRILGGLLAAAIMVGAGLVNIMAREFTPLAVNIFILVAALIVIWSRKDQAKAMLRRT